MTSEFQTYLTTVLSGLRPPNHRSKVSEYKVAPNITGIYHTSDDEAELHRWMVSQHVRSWRLVSDISVVVIHDNELRLEMMEFARGLGTQLGMTPGMSRIVAGNIMGVSDAVRWMIKHGAESFITIWIPEFGERAEEFLNFINVVGTISVQMRHELQLHFGAEPPDSFDNPEE